MRGTKSIDRCLQLQRANQQNEMPFASSHCELGKIVILEAELVQVRNKHDEYPHFDMKHKYIQPLTFFCIISSACGFGIFIMIFYNSMTYNVLHDVHSVLVFDHDDQLVAFT